MQIIIQFRQNAYIRHADLLNASVAPPGYSFFTSFLQNSHNKGRLLISSICSIWLVMKGSHHITFTCTSSNSLPHISMVYPSWFMWYCFHSYYFPCLCTPNAILTSSLVYFETQHGMILMFIHHTFYKKCSS